MTTLEKQVLELKGTERRFVTRLLDENKIMVKDRGHYFKIFKSK
tara:strand:- start:6641 stop:6772 length:132 start_codon:yes stop_codon:yes gene_type:complete